MLKDDRIWLYGIKCRVKVGVPPAERRKRQIILVDIGLETDVSRPAASDDFRLAVDYFKLAKAVKDRAQRGERQLVETLAEQIAATALEFSKAIRAVSVRLEKRPALMPGVRVVVKIRRSSR